MILIIDFGSQYTQLIAKRLRKLGFESEIESGSKKWSELESKVKSSTAIILSGSPLSVGEEIKFPAEVLESKKAILGLCYGYQNIAAHLGGAVGVSTDNASLREYGAAQIKKEISEDPLLKGMPDTFKVWMSHGDSVTGLPDGAELVLSSKGHPAGFRILDKKIWALQFHPEVEHTEFGDEIFNNFATQIAGLKKNWDLKNELIDLESKLKRDFYSIPRVFCAVSGGVDSSVLAVLLSRVTTVDAIFVDHGLQREYDLKDLKEIFARYPGIRLHVLDEEERFLSALSGKTDPEEKRKTIGKLFIESFENFISKKLSPGEAYHLAQGTIYSDVIESAGAVSGLAAKIKSHHNVGGMPEDHPFIIHEPLRAFFKDEVRELGALLGIEKEFLARHPFPGPGLAIRLPGEVSKERLNVLRRADALMYEELKRSGLYQKTWQAACMLLPLRTVGVKGDGRSYEYPLVLRWVTSVDAMTAEACEFEISTLKSIASKICNEVSGVGRVLYDLTSKPPGTIEWE